MKRLRRFFHHIILWCLGNRPSRPQDIPKALSPDVLARAMQEARFLTHHQVDVRDVPPEEIPLLPRPAEKHRP